MKLKILQVVILFLSMLSMLCVADAKDRSTLRLLWSTGRYTAIALPSAWRPAFVPRTESRVDKFMAFDLRKEGLSIPKFIAHYGLPDRYLVGAKPSSLNFLVYDLPSGHAVVLYVAAPPYNTFSLAVVMDSSDNLLKLIK